MTPVMIAVSNRSLRVTDDQVQAMVTACTIQARDHASPAWGRLPPMMSFVRDETLIPFNAYHIVIADSPDMDGVLGYHTETNNGRIVGYVFTDPVLDNGGVVLYDPKNPQNTSVSSVLSHEVLEAFIDPFVNGWADGPVLDQGSEYALEVADPVEGDSYAIDVGGQLVSVSNFVMPNYFDNNAQGAQYDWMNRLVVPFSMSPGGYLVIRRGPGTETQIYGEAMPAWKKAAKEKSRGHGGLKVRRSF